MKKNNLKIRKLRKCELGIKTRSFNRGARYIFTIKGFIALSPLLHI